MVTIKINAPRKAIKECTLYTSDRLLERWLFRHFVSLKIVDANGELICRYGRKSSRGKKDDAGIIEMTF